MCHMTLPRMPAYHTGSIACRFAKRRITASLGLVMLMLLTGCGKTESDQETAGANAEPTAAAAKTNAIPPDTGAPPEADTNGRPAGTAATDDEDSVDVPQDFETVRFEIEALEADAAFTDAMMLTRKASRIFTEPDQQAYLKRVLPRLRDLRREAAGLSFAVRRLEEQQAGNQEVAWEKLLNAGEVGRIYLRRAVRQSPAEVAVEAARRLYERDDPKAVDAVLDRIEASPATDAAAKLLDILAEHQDTLDWRELARLCELSADAGPNRAAAVGVVLDALVRSVPTVQAKDEGDEKATGKPGPALDKLATTTRTELQPRIVRAVLLLVERHPPPPADAEKPTRHSAQQTAARGLRMLKASRYTCVPPETLLRLRHGPSTDAARHLVDLLRATTDQLSIIQLTQLATIAATEPSVRGPLLTVLDQEAFRLDDESLRKLCDMAAQGGENRTEAVATLLNALASWVTPTPKDKDDKVQPDFSKLRPLMSGKLQEDVASTSLALLTRAAQPAKPEGAEQPPEELVAQARSLLLKSRLPQLPGLVVKQLTEKPPQPVAEMLIGLLGTIPDQVRTGQLTALCALAEQDTPPRPATVELVLDTLAWSVGGGRPVKDKPDQTTAPALEELRQATPESVQTTVTDALMSFLADHAALDEEAAKANAALAEQSRKLLVTSGYRSVPDTALERLKAAPAVPVAEMLVGVVIDARLGRGPDIVAGLVDLAAKEGAVQRVALDDLREVPDELSGAMLKTLCDTAARPSPNQAPALDVILTGLEWSVGGGRPVKNKPDQTTPPALDQLPQVTGDALEQRAVETLVTYLQQRAAPPEDEPEAETKTHTALQARTKKMLIESGYRSVPHRLVSGIKTTPPPAVVMAFSDILRQMPERLTPDLLADISAIARSVEGDSQKALANLVVAALQPESGGK